MNNKNTDKTFILPAVSSFEEYEMLKKKMDIFEEAARAIIHRHHLPEESLALFPDGTNIVFSCGGERIIKIYPPFHEDQFRNEFIVLEHLKGKLCIQTPVVEYAGALSTWSYLVMNRVEGILLETIWETMNDDNKAIILHELGLLISEVHTLPINGLEKIGSNWNIFINEQIRCCIERHRSFDLPEYLIKEIPEYIAGVPFSLLCVDKPVLLTGEYTPMNILVKKHDETWHLSGLIDFGDVMLGLPEYDLLGPGAFLIQGNKKLLKIFLTAYGHSNQFTDELSHRLTSLMLLHRYSNLNVQLRIKNWKDKVHHLKDLENLVWGST